MFGEFNPRQVGTQNPLVGDKAAANTVATFANGTLVLAAANLNFNNTATVNVSAAANGTTQSNVAFVVNAAAVLVGVVSGNTSNVVVTYNANGNTVIDTLASGGAGSNLTPVFLKANAAYQLANQALVIGTQALIDVYALNPSLYAFFSGV
jgi:hypothetical protein